MNTSTVYIPFRATVILPETSSETMIAVVPPELVGPDDDPGSNPMLALLLQRLSTQAADSLAFVIRAAEWWVTRDPEVVEQRSAGDRCPTCRAGTDRALLLLRDEPDAVLAVGRLSWCS